MAEVSALPGCWQMPRPRTFLNGQKWDNSEWLLQIVDAGQQRLTMALARLACHAIQFGDIA